MICSEARRLADRRAALEAAGGDSPRGASPSRALSLTRGLIGSAVVAEDAALIEERSRDFFRTLKPQNDFHCWLVTQVSLNSIRIDRSQRIERRVRDKIAIRAELAWDDDRRLAATLLGEQLGNRPEVVVDQLRRSLHGCEWLMGRWAMLAHVADLKRAWTPAQEQLAFDLLATPPEFRAGHKPGASLDLDGRVVEGADDPAAVARREIAALKARREALRGQDEAERALAKADLGDDSDPELRRHRRHEATLHRRIRWSLDQIRYQSPAKEPLRGLEAAWLGRKEPTAPKLPAPLPTPAPVAEAPITAGRFPDLHAPFDLEPDEIPPPGQKADFPAILAARHDRKLRKAEARRQARRKRLDDLRA